MKIIDTLDTKIREFEAKYPYLGILFSALVFSLSFYPFGIWALIVPAFALSHVFAAHASKRSRSFWYGAIVGIIFSLCMSYVTLIQFHWIDSAYLFTYLVRLSVIPIVMFAGVASGLCFFLYAHVRTLKHPICNAGFAATAYTLVELLFSHIFHGYYFGTIAYAFADVDYIRPLAAYIGAHGVSYLIAFIGVLFTELLLARGRERNRVVYVFVCIAVVLFFVGIVKRDEVEQAPAGLVVSLVQDDARVDAFLQRDASQKLGHHRIEERIRDASRESDVVVYPFSPVSGIVYIDNPRPIGFSEDVLVASDEEIGAWLRSIVGDEVVVFVWVTTYEDGVYRNELIGWKNETIIARYAKRNLYPFMDYTPELFKTIGLYTTPVDATPGSDWGGELFEDMNFSGAVCSEVHSVVPDDNSDILLAVGSEAMFVDGAAGRFNLASAQYRATEYGIPVVRSSKFGPSAVIDATGSIVNTMPFGAVGSISERIGIKDKNKTPYETYGYLPLLVVMLATIAGSILRKRQSVLGL